MGQMMDQLALSLICLLLFNLRYACADSISIRCSIPTFHSVYVYAILCTFTHTLTFQ
jgi:hypothetical protein